MEKDKYISLSQASKLCPYTQEYLSSKARQGKFKAIKLGRKWVTTKEWLDGYVSKNSKPKEKKKKVKKQELGLNFNLIIFLSFSVLIFSLFSISGQGFLGLFNDANHSLELTAKGMFYLGDSFFTSTSDNLFACSDLWSESFNLFSDYFAWLGKDVPLKADIFSIFTLD